MTELKIGTPVCVGWNGAKYFSGGEDYGMFSGRVEAVGYDWIVIRDSLGESRATTCPAEDWSRLEISVYSGAN